VATVRGRSENFVLDANVKSFIEADTWRGDAIDYANIRDDDNITCKRY
jgi:hypothetical protein